MRRSCAYCDGDGPLTREHVWPSGFLDRTGRRGAHLSTRSGTVHGADYVVKDVCEQCNNVQLSGLDDYFCRLYDSQMQMARGFDERHTLVYDYELLSRVLLKIAFNSARLAGSDITPFAPLRRYILRGGGRPKGFFLAVELVSPAVPSDWARNSNLRELRPQGLYGSKLGALMTPNGSAAVLRTVNVNSFFFHMLLRRAASSQSAFKRACRELPEYVEGVVPLPAGEASVELRTSPQNAISSIQFQLERHRDQYREFFDKYGNKTS